jgi:GGDEF domain-containing protein
LRPRLGLMLQEGGVYPMAYHAEVLRLFAHHLRQQLNEGERAARLGGDEFAVILPCVAGEQEVLARATAICGGIDRQLRNKAKARNTAASAGCAISAHGEKQDDPEPGAVADEFQNHGSLRLRR